MVACVIGRVPHGMPRRGSPVRSAAACVAARQRYSARFRRAVADERRAERRADEADADQAGDDLGHLVLDGDQQHHGQRADRPVRAVLEVDVLGQRALADQVHGQRPDVHRADAEADGDDDRCPG